VKYRVTITRRTSATKEVIVEAPDIDAAGDKVELMLLDGRLSVEDAATAEIVIQEIEEVGE
jgi:hypothetical protein